LRKKKLILANADEIFTEDDLQKVRNGFQAEMDQVQRELVELQSRRTVAATALSESANRLQQTPPQTTNQIAIFELRETAETRRAQLETIDTAVNVLRFMLQADTIAAAIWEARFDAYRSRNLSTLHTAEKQLHEFRARVALWKTYYSDQLETVASRVALHQERLAKVDASSAIAGVLRERLDSLRRARSIPPARRPSRRARRSFVGTFRRSTAPGQRQSAVLRAPRKHRHEHSLTRWPHLEFRIIHRPGHDRR
jgi:hypothetical protein